MFTHILDVFNSLKATGVVAFFVAVIPVVYKLINPYFNLRRVILPALTADAQTREPLA